MRRIKSPIMCHKPTRQPGSASWAHSRGQAKEAIQGQAVPGEIRQERAWICAAHSDDKGDARTSEGAKGAGRSSAGQGRGRAEGDKFRTISRRAG